MALSHYKLTFADHMPTVLKQLALHPWHYYNLYLGQKNPVLIIVSITVRHVGKVDDMYLITLG